MMGTMTSRLLTVALVRVPVGMRAQLAVRLRSAVARHMASRTPGELRFQIDPKDLI